jgi:NAD+ synthase
MPPPEPGLSRDALRLDAAAATDEIADRLQHVVYRVLRKRGAVVGLSGGIDSSVTAALCVRAFGADRVLGLLMPEADSADDTLELSRLVGASLGIEVVLEEITPILEAAGCYERRDAAIRSVLPDYGPGWRSKIVLPTILGRDGFSVYSVVAEDPGGNRIEARLSADAYRGVVAATNFKQRTRKMLEYHHADRRDFAVAGTPNRLEYDQGFFVKLGDGAADVKPIAHLYKTQVFQLAEHLGLPEEIRSRPPTTDTYSLPQSQEEFYFALPYDLMDLCLYARDRELPASALVEATGLSEDDVERVYRDIDRKREATRYLHLGPQLVEDVPSVHAHEPAPDAS